MTKKTATAMIVFLGCISLPALPPGIDAAEGAGDVLIMRETGREYSRAVGGMISELGDDFTLHVHTVNETYTSDSIASLMRTIRPSVVVLMDNHAVGIYKRYCENAPVDDPVVPSISLMGVSIDKAIESLKNSSGILYEIPLATAVMNLRTLSATPLRRVGVVYRPVMESLVARNRKYCRRLDIKLVGVALPEKTIDLPFTLRTSLRHLLRKEKVDALWVLNDSRLLNPSLIEDVWGPAIEKYRVPSIVGVEVLADPRIGMGTIAVLPDHLSLGMQAAQMVTEILRSGDGSSYQRIIQPPLSVVKILNLRHAREVMSLSRENLGTIDKVLK